MMPGAQTSLNGQVAAVAGHALTFGLRLRRFHGSVILAAKWRLAGPIRRGKHAGDAAMPVMICGVYE
jgi:hypothetical protein